MTERAASGAFECRGRVLQVITADIVAAAPREDLEAKVTNNEQLERAGCAKAPNPSGRLQ